MTPKRAPGVTRGPKMPPTPPREPPKTLHEVQMVAQGAAWPQNDAKLVAQGASKPQNGAKNRPKLHPNDPKLREKYKNVILLKKYC